MKMNYFERVCSPALPSALEGRGKGRMAAGHTAVIPELEASQTLAHVSPTQ
jgi:hypothetical protein